MEISLTEENYLKAIYSINLLNGGAGVSTKALADHLKNKAGTVSDMLKRLSEKKLVRYEKYRAVKLSGSGEKAALGIIRKQRLWEVFLTAKLKFSWEDVHDIAEQLEHIRSEELVTRLDAYLGHPRFDPHGDPIPDNKGHLQSANTRALAAYTRGGRFIFTGVSDHSRTFLRHLNTLGLRIGDAIIVEERNGFDGSLRVRIGQGASRYISEKVSTHILVKHKK